MVGIQVEVGFQLSEATVFNRCLVTDRSTKDPEHLILC